MSQCDDGNNETLNDFKNDPTFACRAVEKVRWWLDREEHGDQLLGEDFGRRREQNNNPVFQEPEFVQTEKKKASLFSQARKQMSCCFLELSSRQKPIEQEGSYSCLPLSRRVGRAEQVRKKIGIFFKVYFYFF